MESCEWSMLASVFNVVHAEKTAKVQVPGTAHPENVEGFVIGDQQQRRLKGNSCVCTYELRPSKTRWPCCTYMSSSTSVSVKRWFTGCEKREFSDCRVSGSVPCQRETERRGGLRKLKQDQSPQLLSHPSNPTLMDQLLFLVSKYKKSLCWTLW